MKSQNQISIDIPAAIISEVTEHMRKSKELLLPYLQGLTAQERKTLFKMGDKTIATVQKVDGYMKTNPEFVPAYMNTDEFTIDASVASKLEPIANLAKQISTDITDTVMLSGSEALQAALLYYGQVREALSKGIVTARPIYEDLQPRFSR